MEKIRNFHSRRKESKRIIIQELMFNQMRESLGKNVRDYVESTRQTLQNVGPLKTRKIVLAVEKNLNQFIKGSYQNKIQLSSELSNPFKTFQSQITRVERLPIFSSRLLNEQLKKSEGGAQTWRQQGVLQKRLLTASRKMRRKEKPQNILLDRKKECYSARNWKRWKEKSFNVVIKK